MDNHGALVGWSHQDYGDRIMLRIESFDGPASDKRGKPDITRILMTKNQAGILSEYLARASGYAKSSGKRPGFFARYLG